MRLSLVALLVPDYDAGIAFFTGVGFELIEDSDQGAGKRWVVVRRGSAGRTSCSPAPSAARRAAIGNQAGGRVGFFLTTTEFRRRRRADHRAPAAPSRQGARAEPYGAGRGVPRSVRQPLGSDRSRRV